MKLKMLLAAGVAASVLLAACAGLGAIKTPAQVAAQVCPMLNDELGTLSAAALFTGGAADTLNNSVMPQVNAVCAAGATVTQVNVQSISSAAVPLLIDLVDASSFSAQQKTAAILAIGTIKGMIDTAFPATTTTTSTPAAPASTPLLGNALQ